MLLFLGHVSFEKKSLFIVKFRVDSYTELLVHSGSKVSRFSKIIVVFFPINTRPKNIIIQWEAPEVTIQHKLTNLGILKADPNDYRKMYGPTLKKTSELPSIAHEVPVPPGLALAADYKPTAPRLSGDLDALKLINLEEHGLSEYKSQLELTGNSWMNSSSSLTTVIPAK